MKDDSFDAHPSDAALQAYVTGADADGAEMGDDMRTEAMRIETHVAACPACAARLRAEAQLEVMLGEAADSAVPTTLRALPPRPRRHTLAWLALAASVLLAMSFGLATGLAMDVARWLSAGPKTAELRVICPDGADQARCIARAHARGLYVDYPPSAGAPALAERPRLQGVEPLFAGLSGGLP